jgi:hypothetical protein
MGIPKVAVGAMTDQIGLRVTNCQIGCFKVDKIINDSPGNEPVDDSVLARIKDLENADRLTCSNVFALAAELGLPAMAVARVANARNIKVHQCQLGCF